MLKFHQIVLRKFLALFITLFIIVGAIVYFWEYEFYLQSSQNALEQDIELLTLQIDNKTNFDTLVQQIKKTLDIRATIVNADGKVVAESDSNKTTMENHRYRPEIMMSDTQDFGIMRRESHTINKELLYVAKKTTLKGKTYYIRLAREIKGINQQIFELGVKIFAVLILFFMAIFYVSYKINLDIQNEVKRIVSFLKALTKKKKPTYIQSDYSQEFALITSLLTKVSQIIVKKEKRKSKYTEKLQKLNQQKDDIISAISHEFKNPIAVVNGYSQTLLDDSNINPNIREKFLKKIHTNGTKLSELINTLRLSLKLDSNQKALQLTQVSLYDLVTECSDALKLSYPYRKIIIEGNKDVVIHADATMFSIVVTNLIENALKYSEDEVHLFLSEKELDVKDSGIGINKKELENITQKFYRVNKNSWNNSLGLGLFLVNKIINLHNFTLQIESKVHEGSTFSVRF